MTRMQIIAMGLVAGAMAARAVAQDVQYVEENGARYQVTKQVVQRPVTHTTFEPRTTTQYRERYTTDMQEVQRTYQVPVTEQQWVPGYQRTLNVFAPPVLTYRLMPVTRWETRTETVRVPSTRRDVLPETMTQHVPVTRTHLVQEEHTHRVFAGFTGTGPNTANIANNNGTGGANLSSTTSVATRNDVGGGGDDGSRDDGDQISRRK
jgi:hypothetical protein